MKQLILPESFNNESVYPISQEDSHYLLHVQRKGNGSVIKLMDINGNKYNGKIINTENNICTFSLKLIEEQSKNSNSIILMQSIPKGKKIDLMIRQAVEIGVNKFIPIMADHSVPQFKTPEEKKKKRDRWEKIVKEASQQSGTSAIMKLEPLQTFKEALNTLEDYTGIFFHQDPLENETLHNLLNKPESTVVLVIGPEGGLSSKEVELLMENSFKPALLGNNILRAETATTFALGAVKMILEESGSWSLI